MITLKNVRVRISKNEKQYKKSILIFKVQFFFVGLECILSYNNIENTIFEIGKHA